MGTYGQAAPQDQGDRHYPLPVSGRGRGGHLHRHRHALSQSTSLAFYGGLGLELTAGGDLHVDGHHTVEDVGIVLGQALREAMGDKAGIRRYASAYIPMDEALCFTALDFSNRAYLVFDAPMPQGMIGGYDACLTREFMRALAVNAGLTLHMRALYGENAHHITEALFKSLGVALREAVQVTGQGVVSTKGVL